MKYKLAFGAGFAAGYYLGAKAGRPRSDEINRRLRAIAESPRAQSLAATVRTAVDEQLGRATEAVTTTVKAKVVETARAARDHIPDKVLPHRPPSNGHADGSPNGTATIPPAANPGGAAPPPPGGPHSSSR
jgi:hypothetical protein